MRLSANTHRPRMRRLAFWLGLPARMKSSQPHETCGPLPATEAGAARPWRPRLSLVASTMGAQK